MSHHLLVSLRFSTFRNRLCLIDVPRSRCINDIARVPSVLVLLAVSASSGQIEECSADLRDARRRPVGRIPLIRHVKRPTPAANPCGPIQSVGTTRGGSQTPSLLLILIRRELHPSCNSCNNIPKRRRGRLRVAVSDCRALRTLCQVGLLVCRRR